MAQKLIEGHDVNLGGKTKQKQQLNVMLNRQIQDKSVPDCVPDAAYFRIKTLSPVRRQTVDLVCSVFDRGEPCSLVFDPLCPYPVKSSPF